MVAVHHSLHIHEISLLSYSPVQVNSVLADPGRGWGKRIGFGRMQEESLFFVMQQMDGSWWSLWGLCTSNSVSVSDDFSARVGPSSFPEIQRHVFVLECSGGLALLRNSSVGFLKY